MPVIDETKYTLEIKALRKTLKDEVDALAKRVASLEEKASKGK